MNTEGTTHDTRACLVAYCERHSGPLDRAETGSMAPLPLPLVDGLHIPLLLQAHLTTRGRISNGDDVLNRPVSVYAVMNAMLPATGVTDNGHKYSGPVYAQLK